VHALHGTNSDKSVHSHMRYLANPIISDF
jgi:hypothetical protein